MCTINSLDSIWQFFLKFGSIRTVLIMLLWNSYQDSSGALMGNPPMTIQISAPADITVTIFNKLSCDTNFIMPPALVTGNCPGTRTFMCSSIFTSLNTNGGLMYFPTGIYEVIYKVTDACGVMDTDTTQVTVYDNQVPNLVCETQQTINLPSNGFADVPASIFDGGATDHCGHVYFKIKRMFAPSGYVCSNPGNPQNAFDDVVRFCCEDVDSNSIRVILRVYDIFPGVGVVNDSLHRGHYIDCMIQALVRDKIGPDITCPYNVTVSCGTHLDSVLLSMGPVISDNCGLRDVDTIINNQLDACGSGILNRTFLATDRNGQTSSCTQSITVTKVNTFNGLDPNQLRWPEHKVIYACRIDVDTINAGIPIINEDKCANVLTTKRDELYDFNRGGVCAKVLRYWEVIDYCKYNRFLKPNPKIPQNGYYSFIQEIKIMDSIAPVIGGIQDTAIGIQTSGCQPGFIKLQDVFASDCGSTSNIAFHYEIDFFGDATIDQLGPGPNASSVYPIGVHKIHYYASDSCHNQAVRTINLEVFDSKPPTANAIYGLSSSLSQMPAGTMVCISAEKFNAKSSDNCTPPQLLRFSFSKEINDTIRCFNCDSLGKRDITLFVWDSNLNSNEVNTFIIIDDLDNLCPTTLTGVNVFGQIQTNTHQMIKDALVDLSFDGKIRQTISDQNGKFKFSSIPKDKELQLIPSCDQNYNEGISTADIIKMQRYILGIELFENEHQYLAADIDENQSITTKDVVFVRNLILGKIDQFPLGKSYTFLNGQYVFQNPKNPFKELDLAKQIKLTSGDDGNGAEIAAVKMGDVNNSFTNNNIKIQPTKEINLVYKIVGNNVEIFPQQSEILDGFQFEMENKGLCFQVEEDITSDLPGWGASNYFVTENKIRLSYSGASTLFLDKDQPICNLHLVKDDDNCIPFLHLSSEFENEGYMDTKVARINSLTPISESNNGEIDFVKVFPNPFQDQLMVHFNLSVGGPMRLEVININQQLCFDKEIILKSGITDYALSKLEIGGSGVFVIHCYNDKISKFYKIIAE